jgi:PKHD-type hydroxylase
MKKTAQNNVTGNQVHIKNKEKKLISQPLNPSWIFEVDKVHGWAFWNNLFTPEECRQIIDHANQYEKRMSGINVNAELDKVIRDSKTVWIYPNEDTRWMYDRISNIVISLNDTYFKFDIFGMVEGFQFTEYNAPTGHYGSHTDCILNGIIRKLSIVIQLSDPDDYKGGELELNLSGKPDAMIKDQGTLIMFPSFVLHQVKPITKGTRYSLVGWITGKPFK